MQLAQITNPVLSGPLQGASGAEYISALVSKGIGLGLTIGVLVFFFIMLIGAIQWIASGGDKNAIEQARGKITNAVIGIVILFAIFAILKLIGSFFDLTMLQELQLNLGPLQITGSGTVPSSTTTSPAQQNGPGFLPGQWN